VARVLVIALFVKVIISGSSAARHLWNMAVGFIFSLLGRLYSGAFSTISNE